MVAATVRDLGFVLPRSLASVAELCACFERCSVVVYENDSTDGTGDLLQVATRRFPFPFRWLHDADLRGSRTVRLAHGRNRILRAVRDDPALASVGSVCSR